MLPVEHMDRLYTTLKAKQGQVTMVKLHAGHMDAYETAAQVTQFIHVITMVSDGCQQTYSPQTELVPTMLAGDNTPETLSGCLDSTLSDMTTKHMLAVTCSSQEVLVLMIRGLVRCQVSFDK